MSIQAYFGMTGSGKSYNAVANILVPALKDNRTVVTNLPLRKSALFADIDLGNVIHLPKDMNSDNVHQFLRIDLFPPGCVFILDECFSLFPSGQKANNVPTSLKEFYSMHRHVVGSDNKASDIYILAQNIGQLAAWLRDMIHSMVIHTDLAPTGLKNQYRCDFYQFELHGTRNKEKFIQSSIGTIKEPYINYYISNSKTEAGQNGDVLENVIDKRTGLGGAHKKNLITAGILFLLTFCLLGYSAMSMMSDDEETEGLNPEQDQSINPENDNTPSRIKSNKTVPAAPSKSSNEFPIAHYNKPVFQKLPVSEEWRLTGVIRGQRHKVAILRSKDATVQIDLLGNCFYSKDLRDWACWFQDSLVAYHTGPSFDYSDTQPTELSDVLPSFSL
jgi:zona occludens toxin (predicted ATPase)